MWQPWSAAPIVPLRSLHVHLLERNRSWWFRFINQSLHVLRRSTLRRELCLAYAELCHEQSKVPSVEGKNAEGVVMKSELSVNGGGVGHGGRGDRGQHAGAGRRGEGSGGGGESSGGDDGLEAGDGGPGRGEEGSRGKDEHLLERLAYHYGTDKSRDDHKYTDQ